MKLPCINNNYTSFLETLSNTTQDPKGAAMMRQWTYQTCTQFGYCRLSFLVKISYVNSGSPDYLNYVLLWEINKKQGNKTIRISRAFHVLSVPKCPLCHRGLNNCLINYIFLFSDQTCEHNSSCVFSTRLPDLKHDLDMCSNVFKIPPEDVYQQVAFTNAYYGGDRPKGSRTVFVNGKECKVGESRFGVRRRFIFAPMRRTRVRK